MVKNEDVVEDVVKDDKPKKVSAKELEHEKLLKSQVEAEKVAERFNALPSVGKIIQDGVYNRLVHYIEMVADPDSNSHLLIVLGEAGLSKTWTIKKVLTDINASFVHVRAFITPPDFFVLLYKNRSGRVIYLDDSVGCLENIRSLSYLKSATEKIPVRSIQNRTQKPPKDLLNDEFIPNEFEFTSKIIISTNRLPKTLHMDAVMSRANKVRIALSRDEKIAIMKEIIKTPEPPYNRKLNIDERKYCVDFIAEQGINTLSSKINFRTLEQLYDYYIFCKGLSGGFAVNEQTFKDMALGELEIKDENGNVDAHKVFILKMESDDSYKGMAREEKCQEYCKMFNINYPSNRIKYYRIAKEIGIKGDSDGEA